jgi:protein-S-isoprenylcysteine O-methyltransferase Ste14
VKTLHIIAVIVWALFWIYWFASAFTAKRSTGRGFYCVSARLPLIAGVLIVRLWHPRRLEVHSVALGVFGMAIIVCGLAVAVWARVYLGRNWGMPMTTKEDPELVTSGPYSWVRHPIYSGLVLACAGTVLLSNVTTVLIVLGFLITFTHSALVEERNMAGTFPDVYPAYRARTKMLIPFVF